MIVIQGIVLPGSKVQGTSPPTSSCLVVTDKLPVEIKTMLIGYAKETGCMVAHAYNPSSWETEAGGP
jgi:hypothetical protein